MAIDKADEGEHPGIGRIIPLLKNPYDEQALLWKNGFQKSRVGLETSRMFHAFL